MGPTQASIFKNGEVILGRRMTSQHSPLVLSDAVASERLAAWSAGLRWRELAESTPVQRIAALTSMP